MVRVIFHPKRKPERLGRFLRAIAAVTPNNLFMGMVDMKLHCFIAAVCAAFSVAAGPVMINEVMYHPASEDVHEEYLELVNIGTTDIDLNGWRFARGIRFTFTNTTLCAGGYLVIAADIDAFDRKYPGITNRVGNWEGLLSNSGEVLELEDNTGAVIDRVRYADEGDWAQRRRGPWDHNHRGVRWDAGHDGQGHSLELIDPDISNDYGGNWAASSLPEGSPGKINGVLNIHTPPLILEVRHFPLVPRSTDRVVVTLRLLDEPINGLTAQLFWRQDSSNPGPFASVAMHDDGLHEDGGPGDAVFGGVIPSQDNNAIVEFYVVASDADGLVRKWPGQVLEEDQTLAQVANALYQVDDAGLPGGQPLYKLILRESDRAELYSIGHASNGDQNSDAQFNATFLSLDGTGEECRYTVGVRNRGHGSRNKQPNNYRVNFRTDEDWRGVTALNINGQYPHLQQLGAALSLASGLAAAQARPVQLRVNNANLGLSSGRMYNTTYVVNEVYNSQFADHRFPSDGSGNVYRALRDIAPSAFEWRGPAPSAYTNTWFKTTNKSEDDWSDLLNLARVLGTNDHFSTASARQVADIEEWLRYFAVMALIDNRETSPNTGYNDDYLLYAGIVDPRFRLLPYDFDTILGQGDAIGSTTSSIFGALGQPAFQRVLEAPEFRDAYFQTLRHLLATSFSAERFDAFVDQTLSDYVPANSRENIKSWMASRRSYVQSQIPGDLPPEKTVRATVRGVPRSPTPVASARIQVEGADVVGYRYRLDGAPYTSARPVSEFLELSSMASGGHELQVVGGDESGWWQPESEATSSYWTIAPSWPAVRLNEVLARNSTVSPHEGTYPDFIELFNEGATTIDLSGLRLTDDPAKPDKFTFPGGTSLAAGKFLLLHANDPDGTTGIHVGFSLKADGEGVYLFDRTSSGGGLLDQVIFGPQLVDRSIGRVQGSGEWELVAPSPGAENIRLPIADIFGLRINEWLADGRAVFSDDFIELYNPSGDPVAIGGLVLTDNITSPMEGHRIVPLSFIAPQSCLAFLADGETGKGPLHLGFKLAPEQGEIGLFATDGAAIDLVLYGMQQTDISEGRMPSGGDSLASFLQPTPGAPNPPMGPNVVEELVALVSLTNLWAYNATQDLSAEDWTAPGYDDLLWPVDRAGFWHDADPIAGPTNTPLNLGRTTYYFRTTFEFAGDPEAVALRFLGLIDDGAVVHLNGSPVYRLRMPATGTITYNTFAASTVNNAEVEGPFPISSSNLHPGVNVVAVEVHQSGSNSGDIAFALQLETVRYITNQPNSPLVLNEVLANSRTVTNGTGRVVDYIELLNVSATAFDAGGMSLTDDPANPRRFVLPVGIVLPPRGRWAIDCDGHLPPSETNTGFGLDSDGGMVQLFDNPARTGGLIGSLSYGPQVGDLSLGRIPDGTGQWTLTQPTRLAENLAVTMGEPSALRINEWLAANPDGDDWFELFNPQNQPVALGGFHLSDDPADRFRFTIAPLSFVGAGADAHVIFIADNKPGNGPAHVNFKLDADGDFLGLYESAGGTLDAVSFGPQQSAVSEGRFPDGASTTSAFSASMSRGAANWLPLPNVVVNEVLAHTDPPLEDAIEFYNLGGTPVAIGGWYFSNSKREPRRYRLPEDAVLPALGYLTLYEYQFNVPGSADAFTFNAAHGDNAILSAADALGNLTGWRAAAEFGPSANGVSFGRFPMTVGTDFVALNSHTFGMDVAANVEQFRLGTGAPNSGPRIGPVVLTELMFCPPSVDGVNDNTADEFLELFNTLSVTQPLFDPGAPTNSWELSGAISFRFPPGLTLTPGEHVLIVAFDPVGNPSAAVAFRYRYRLPDALRIFGPWQGRLGNDGETVNLYQPDPPQVAPHPDAGLVPYVLVESVTYGVASPWAGGAVATGFSLQRANPSGYGNDPSNWVAAPPSPGTSTAGSSNLDANGDGLPDAWQSQYFGTANALDAAPAADPDQDGLSNLAEYLSGTAPDNSSSTLRVALLFDERGAGIVQFEAAAGKTVLTSVPGVFLWRGLDQPRRFRSDGRPDQGLCSRQFIRGRPAFLPGRHPGPTLNPS